ncbi:P-loop containing nucleoside triphosphate hydrolase protein [Entophlyctis helioformis]|nr:P-loop containing nucleoside triphosphate hydrolase protein [Entophlyctis helioformis]
MRNKTLTGADGSVDDLAHQLQSVSLQSQSQSAASQLPHLPVRLEWHDLELWLKHIPPSQAASIGFDTTRRSVPWSRLGGYAKIKAKLSQLVSWPHQHPDVFARLGVKPAAGILLYGPTGCGKTMLVHATASEFQHELSTDASGCSNEIFSKYLGESEANIRALFAAARQLTPCIVFIDELDAIASRREWTEDGSGGVNERVLSTLLNEMDGVQERQGVVVMACTNRPEKLDDALLRPGRLDCHVHVGLPSESERQEILRAYARSGVALDLRDGEFESFARETVGFTGADLEVLLR